MCILLPASALGLVAFVASSFSPRRSMQFRKIVCYTEQEGALCPFPRWSPKIQRICKIVHELWPCPSGKSHISSVSGATQTFRLLRVPIRLKSVKYERFCTQSSQAWKRLLKHCAHPVHGVAHIWSRHWVIVRAEAEWRSEFMAVVFVCRLVRRWYRGTFGGVSTSINS